MAHAAQRPAQAAFLHRVVSLNDRWATQIFTFILPPHLVKGFLSECASKDFTYAYQKWRVAFTRDDQHLGCFLLLRSPAAGTEVRLDFSFTILNRNHFTGSEACVQKAAVFDATTQRVGRSTFLCINDLEHRGFLFADQRALVELEMKNASTLFHEELQLPRDIRELQLMERVESAYFSFAGCDWSLAVHLRKVDQFGDVQDCQPSVVMYRHSSFDHWCRIRYRVSFRLSDSEFRSDIIDQMLDTEGYGAAHPIGQAGSLFSDLNPSLPLRLSLSLLSMWPITTVDLVPTSRHRNAARCYDTDKQQWIVESDILGRLLKLRLFYSDVRNVPRNFCRLVSWDASVIPHSAARPPVRSRSGPFTGYYSQKDADRGFEVEMELPVEEICDDNAGYTQPGSGRLTAQIEWHHSHLLYLDFYHHFDDVTRLHKHQMSREVAALQSENYGLEKQLFSCQLSASSKEAGPDCISHTSFEGNGSRDSGIGSSDGRQRKAAAGSSFG